jgi:hypothetical protein
MSDGIHHTLNRLLTTLHRSLPMYLTYACPWTHRGDERAVTALKSIVENQKELAGRVAQFILSRHETIEMGEYPIEFLDTHDLSLDYLLTRLVEFQKRDVAAIERCVAELQKDRQAAALAEEALGAARGHLETLEELVGQAARG